MNNKGPTSTVIELVAREMARGSGVPIEAFLIPALTIVEEAFAIGRQRIRIMRGIAEIIQ